MHRPGANGEDWHRLRRTVFRRRDNEGLNKLKDIEGAWFPGSVITVIFALIMIVALCKAVELELATLKVSCMITGFLRLYLVSNLLMFIRGVLYHDGSHGLLHKSKAWNDVFVIVLSALAPSATGFKDKDEHKSHHELTYSSEDPDAQQYKTEVQGWRRLFWFAVAPVHRAWQLPFDWGISITKFPVETLWIFFSHAALACLMSPWISCLLLVSWCLRDWTPAGCFSHAMHFSFSHDQASWSTYSFRHWPWQVFGIKWMELLMGNLNYHVEHHDFPRVSWWHLPSLHELFKDDYDALTTFDLPRFVLDFYVTEKNTKKFDQRFHWVIDSAR